MVKTVVVLTAQPFAERYSLHIKSVNATLSCQDGCFSECGVQGVSGMKGPSCPQQPALPSLDSFVLSRPSEGKDM